MKYTALLHDAEEGGFWATCIEVPGANGQGETKDECLADLAAAIKLMIAVNRELALKEDPAAMEESVFVA
jgi:predicted RNase H-like HicB family nuclease